MVRIRALLFLLFAVAMSMNVRGQPASSPSSDIPMADYLALLAQIAPAAREGAEVYLQAIERQCRRPLTSAELRRAISEGGGDPVLMGMIRASHLRDPNALAQLGQRVSCDRRSVR